MVSHPVDMHVGTRLRLRRKMLGMSQDELGRAVGVTFQQVQKYERGTNRIGSSRLYDFARVLSVPVGFFFEEFSADGVADGFGDEPESKNSHNPTREELESKETISLVQAYYRIPDPAVRAKVLGLIKSLKVFQNLGSEMEDA